MQTHSYIRGGGSGSYIHGGGAIFMAVVNLKARATHCSQYEYVILEDGPATELAQDRSVPTWVGSSSTITKNGDSMALQSTCASEFLARASTIGSRQSGRGALRGVSSRCPGEIRGNLGRTVSPCHRQATRVRESRVLRASHMPSAMPRPPPPLPTDVKPVHLTTFRREEPAPAHPLRNERAPRQALRRTLMAHKYQARIFLIF